MKLVVDYFVHLSKPVGVGWKQGWRCSEYFGGWSPEHFTELFPRQLSF